jgi:hypothetical protein
VRHLVQPQTLKSAAVAAVVTGVVCYPRLALWTQKPAPLWNLETILFVGAFVLWAFVFAWHAPFTKRPVFTCKVGLIPFVAATLSGMGVAVILRYFLDPSLRNITPTDYPSNLWQWTAMTLFTLAFTQLVMVFAPFAWLVRLFRNCWIAGSLTVLLGVFVLAAKVHASPTPLPLPLFSALLLIRVALGSLSIFFYLRGGLIPVWWFVLLIQARHLVDLFPVL